MRTSLREFFHRLAAENRRSQQVGNLKEIEKGFAKVARSGDSRDALLLNQTSFVPLTDTDTQREKMVISQPEAMISAIEAQELEISIDLTQQHRELSRDQLERFVRADPLPFDVVSMKLCAITFDGAKKRSLSQTR